MALLQRCRVERGSFAKCRALLPSIGLFCKDVGSKEALLQRCIRLLCRDNTQGQKSPINPYKRAIYFAKEALLQRCIRLLCRDLKELLLTLCQSAASSEEVGPIHLCKRASFAKYRALLQGFIGLFCGYKYGSFAKVYRALVQGFIGLFCRDL